VTDGDQERILRLKFPAMLRFATICCLLSFTVIAAAADRYVSPTGTAGNPGTLAAPWSLAKAANSAVAGDVVYVRGGTYTNAITISVSGTATQPIVFRNYPGETPIIDMTGKSPTLDQSDSPIITIQNRSNIVVQGFTLQNYITSDENGLPEGILLVANGSGTCSNIKILNNTIRNIQQNDPTLGNFNANAHGLKVAGRNANAMNNIVIDGNELYNLHLGASEALVINGNVTNFRVTNNIVRDCNNIGIDLIGYEGSLTPDSINRARDGVVAGNVVYNIDSSFNPAYNGSLTTGGGDRSAGGIYVDGGTRIIIERNLVYGCNFGVEIATEADFGTGTADFITLRNNLIRHNQQAGLIMGGFNASKGSTENCTIINNTFYENGTLASGTQIQGQHHVMNNVFKNNIVVTSSNPVANSVFAVFGSTPASTFTGNVFSYNLYYAPSGSAPTFDINGVTSPKNLAQWQAATSLSGGDTGSTVGEPQFALSHPNQASPITAWQLSASSPAINTGQPSPGYQPSDGEDDISGDSRLRGGRVDRGADEF
jgi:hypothetical protein